jgi:catechol 2,3-dioxygenase-like lactoylglutathione lyase family enzyme
MPPKDGMSIAHFLTVKDIERSARYYEKVFGARILSLGDGNAPGYRLYQFCYPRQLNLNHLRLTRWEVEYEFPR